ncbi:MAG: hypothetical protein GOP50_05015 [Candidatus Heimdallarchaeota archaeon]|nr:hypothetical protein [Candidatus Heimdallarchaeota archaeon]
MSVKNQEEDAVIILKQPKRTGWKDFLLNLVFSLIMLASIYVFLIADIIRPENTADWLIRIFVTVLPLLIFANRTIKEIFYMRDFIKIVGTEIHYRSTPFVMTGFRVKSGTIPLKEVRKYGLSKIPRKLSLDFWGQKTKAMLVAQLRNGKGYFIGEFFSNEDLAEICMNIRHIYPKAKYTTNIPDEFPELQKKEKELSKSKKIKRITDAEEEPEGVGVRKR